MNWKARLVFGMLSGWLGQSAWADYKLDIGYQALVDLPGSAPTGASVKVTQVEASAVPSGDSGYPVYAPDAAAFSGKTFVLPGTPSTAPSPHATMVGGYFYGADSTAAGIANIHSYETNEWFNTLFNPVVTPGGTFIGPASTTDRRIANHSWVGNSDTAASKGLALRLVDRQVQVNEYIQVVGMDNASSTSPLLGSAYNVIAVGRTDGGHDQGSEAVDSTYVAGRTRPDLVAPQAYTSNAAPVVAAVAAQLVQVGHEGAGTLSNGSEAATLPGVGTVYNAERAETIKAALMAGADRETTNTTAALYGDISDYGAGGLSANGLDPRYGAGQVNVLNSYQIVSAGEQDSAEDGGAGIGSVGFDYDPSFGGGGSSNSAGTYSFSAATDLNLSASLVWNLDVSNDGALATTLRNLDLELFDTTTATSTLVAASDSSSDNTENLWLTLFGGHDYELRVVRGGGAPFTWDYALAWRMTELAAPVPLPPALWLFGSALLTVVRFGRGKASPSSV